MRTAAELKYGEKAKISDIDSKHPSSRRILEYGFTPGQEIELVNIPAFKDPIAISIRGTMVAIRKNDASCIILQ